ncbi:unnamed protein product, partial [Effrenium voratum]
MFLQLPWLEEASFERSLFDTNADAKAAWAATSKPKTLNEDPYNARRPGSADAPAGSAAFLEMRISRSQVYAEECAMEACKLGFEVAAEMLETELVFSSCGSLVKGTPDGGFRDAEGLLRLVQVVRVPLLEHMDEDEAADCLYNTVLAKIVKSQVWMKETGTLPHDFVIFCWLPPVGAYRACLENTDALLWTEALLWNVRAGGWPFSLVVRVPEQPGRVFPRNFGFRNYRKEQHNPAAELSYFLNPTDFEDDDDEMLFGWDVFVEEEDATVIEEEDVQVLALVRRAIALIERANLAEAAPAEEASDNLSEGAQRNHAADLELFADLDFKKEYGLGAVNSINWARIMFQITYYFYTYFKRLPQGRRMEHIHGH